MSTTEQKIENWKKHGLSNFYKNFYPNSLEGRARLGYMEMSLENLNKLKNGSNRVNSFELLMALSEPSADEDKPDYNFSPFLRVVREDEDVPIDIQFSIQRDALFMLNELVRETLTRAKLDSTEITPEIIFARIDLLLLNITRRLFSGEQSGSRQLVLEELRHIMGRLNVQLEEHIVPQGFVRSVGSIWWLMPDDDLYELMFQSRDTSSEKLRSFYCKRDGSDNQMLFRALSLFADGNEDAQGIRIYPSVVPEKFDSEEKVKIPFSFVFAFFFGGNIGTHRAFIQEGNANKEDDDDSSGVVELEYIQPCPSTCN